MACSVAFIDMLNEGARCFVL